MILAPQGVALGFPAARLRRAAANCCTVSAHLGTVNSMRRWLPWFILVAGVFLVVFCGSLFTWVAWVGRHTPDVEVLVIDTDEGQPVPTAEVTIFDGPYPPIESITSHKPSTFVPDLESPRTKTYFTNSEGRCRFKFAFHAAGSSGTFRDSGYVDTSQVWIRVSAPARGSTLVPLDRRSVCPRDIHDETPVVVTVVLNKCRAE